MDPGQVGSMRDCLDGFLEDLEASAMSEESKTVISHHVRQVLSALDERGINSREAVEDAVHMTMGKAAMDEEVRKDLTTSGMGTRLSETMVFVYQTIGAAKDALLLAKTIGGFLADK